MDLKEWNAAVDKWTLYLENKDKDDDMKHLRGTIEVFKSSTSTVPSWVALGHRRLEKEQPAHKAGALGGEGKFTVPVDLLRVAGYPEDLINGVEEMVLEYKVARPVEIVPF